MAHSLTPQALMFSILLGYIQNASTSGFLVWFLQDLQESSFACADIAGQKYQTSFNAFQLPRNPCPRHLRSGRLGIVYMSLIDTDLNPTNAMIRPETEAICLGINGIYDRESGPRQVWSNPILRTSRKHSQRTRKECQSKVSCWKLLECCATSGAMQHERTSSSLGVVSKLLWFGIFKLVMQSGPLGYRPVHYNIP